MNERKKGAILSYISVILKVVIAFVYTPFLISSLGNSEYGIYNIVGSLAAYLAVLDFGINDSTVRYLVRQRKLGESKESDGIIGSVTLLYLVIGTAMAIGGTVLFFSLDSFLSASFTDQELYLLKYIYVIAFASIVATITFNPITAILVAYEKFVLVKGIEIVAYLITIGTTVVFLLLGYNVIAVVAISAIVNTTGILIKIWYLFRRLKIPFRVRGYSLYYIKELFTYALPIFFVVLVEQIYWKLDNIIIGSKLGPTIVALYAVGIFFQKYIQSFSTAISRVMIPKLILQIDGESDSKEIIKSLVTIARFQLIIVLLIISGLVLFGKEFIILWLGEDYEISYYVMLCVLIPFSVEIVGNIRNTIMQVKGLYWYRSVLILIISLINVGFTVAFVEEYGIVAAGLFTGIALVLGYFGVHIIMQWKINIRFIEFFFPVWSKAVIIMAICTPIALLLNDYTSYSWLTFFCKILVFAIVYGISMWFIYLNNVEKGLFKKIWDAISSRKRFKQAFLSSNTL